MAHSTMSTPECEAHIEEKDAAEKSEDLNNLNKFITRLLCSVQYAIDHSLKNTELAMRLLPLIRLHMIVPLSDQRLHQRRWAHLEKTWQKGLRLLKPEFRIILENGVIQHIRGKLNEMKLKFSDIAPIGRILAVMILPLKSTEPPNLPAIVDFTKRIFGGENTDSVIALEYAALKCDIITGGHSCLAGDPNEILNRIQVEASDSHKNFSPVELTKYSVILNGYNWLLKTSYLQKLLQPMYCNEIMKNDYMQEEFINIIRIFVIVNTLYERFGFYSYHDAIQSIAQKIGFFLDVVIINLTKESRKMIVDRISKKAEINKLYWVYGQRYLESKIKEIQENSHPSDLEIISSLGESSTGVRNRENSVTPLVKNEDMEAECGFNRQQAQWRWGGPEDALFSRSLAVRRALRAANKNDKYLTSILILFEAYIGNNSCISPDAFSQAYSLNRNILLCNTFLTISPFLAVVSNGAIGDYLSECVDRKGRSLTAESWNFIIFYLTSLVNSIKFSFREWGCIKVALIARATLKLFCSVQRFVANNHKQRREPNAPYVTFCREWIGSGNSPAQNIVWPIFSLYQLILNSNDNDLNAGHMTTLGALSEALRYLPLHQMKPGDFLSQALYRISTRVAMAALLQYRHPSVKILAFKFLRAIVMASGNRGGNQFYNDLDDGNEHYHTTVLLEKFEDVIKPMQHIVDDMQLCLRDCEKNCQLDPTSENYSTVLGYLMLSIALYEYCDTADGDLAQYYMDHFRKNYYGLYLMKNCLRLLPIPLIKYASDSSDLLLKPATFTKYFTETMDIPIEDGCKQKTLDSLVCRCLFGALAGPGVEQVRDWWMYCPKKTNSLLSRLVSSYVSHPMLNKEFKYVESLSHLLHKAKITVSPDMSHASCKLCRNGDTINLIITYSNGHPLTEPKVTTCFPMAPKTSWLTAYLKQNGRLINAFEMWINATAGMQEIPKTKCFICYCHRDLLNGLLPSLSCRGCKNAFHDGCMAMDKCPICC